METSAENPSDIFISTFYVSSLRTAAVASSLAGGLPERRYGGALRTAVTLSLRGGGIALGVQRGADCGGQRAAAAVQEAPRRALHGGEVVVRQRGAVPAASLAQAASLCS